MRDITLYRTLLIMKLHIRVMLFLKIGNVLSLAQPLIIVFNFMLKHRLNVINVYANYLSFKKQNIYCTTFLKSTFFSRSAHCQFTVIF